MIQGDKPEVPVFNGQEALYLRYRKDDFDTDFLALSAVRFPKQSVNRGNLSEPEDVLFSEEGRFNGLGCVFFLVSDIPEKIEQPNGPTYWFFMRHVPEPDNYSHSEIWCSYHARNDNYHPPSKTVKLGFRVRLCQRISRDRIRIPAVI
jgi:hypothetical protein